MPDSNSGLAGLNAGPMRIFNATSKFAIFLYSTGISQAQIDTAWVRSFQGETMGPHISRAVVSDAQGNVIVAGESPGVGTGFDIVLTKLASNGQLLWDRRHGGSASRDDVLAAILVDPAGNVYAAGSVVESGVVTDGLLLKYSASGDLLWSRTYSYSIQYPTIDSIQSMVADNDGNLILAGGTFSGIGSGRYLLLKYSSSGDLIWERTLNLGDNYNASDARAVAVDATGTIYVTGNHFDVATGTVDVVTIEFTADGVLYWIKTFATAWDGNDRAVSINWGPGGSVYVAGTSEGPNGDDDYFTIRYDTAGTEHWIRRYSGLAGGDDRAREMVVDYAGNVIVTGTSRGFSSLDDFLTIKYDSSSLVVWERRHTGPGFSNDYAHALRVDAAASCYVTGYSNPGVSPAEYATICYDFEGYVPWIRRHGAVDGIADSATSLHVDQYGNVYVTGRGNLNSATDAFTTIKYSPCLPPPVPVGDPFTSDPAPCAGDAYLVTWSSSPGAHGYELFENGDYVYAGVDTFSILIRDSGSFTYTARSTHMACQKSAFTTSGGATAVRACGCHADPACDGVTDILDVLAVVNEAFRGEAPVAEATCQHVSRADVDCDCQVAVTDVVKVIDVAFRDADAGSVFCSACVAPCP